MANVVAWILATVMTLPLLGWYLIYITTVKITKKKNKSIRFASDCSTILFMGAVYFIILELWQRSFILIILSVIFVVAIIFTIIHWKLAGDIHVRKLFKGIWRFNFILFFFVYILLSGYGLILRAIN